MELNLEGKTGLVAIFAALDAHRDHILNFQWLVNPEFDLKTSINVLKHNIVALLEAKEILKKERK